MRRFTWIAVLAAVVSVASTNVWSATTVKLYWLGNSFTGNLYGLQNLVRDMINAGSSGTTVAVSDASIKWGQNLDAQYNDATVMNKISTGDYTHVILQGYEYDGGNAATTIDYGYRIASAVKAAGKIPVIFMCHANYLRVDRFDSVTHVFNILADSAKAPRVPCFPAWRAALAERPGFMLWALANGCDGHHQGDQGQYLDACVFYSYFTGASPIGNSFIPSTSTVTTEQAAFLQRVGWETWRTLVRGDSLAPRLVSATGFAHEGVMVLMNKPVDATTAQQVSHWSLSPSQTIQSATVQDGGSRIFLSITGLTAGSYTLSASGIGDTVTPHNVMPATMTCPVSVATRAGWTSTDVGYPFIAGSTAQSTSSAVTLIASALGTNNSFDQMRFAYQRCHGDFSITARVAGITNHGGSRCGGLMARESDDPSSRMVGTWWPWNAPIITARRTYNQPPADFGWGSQVPTATPYWMRFARTGDSFVYSFSSNGTSWTTTGTTTLALKQDVLVGLTASAGDCSVDTVAFDNIAITGQITTGVAPRQAAVTTPPSLSRSAMLTAYTLSGQRVRTDLAATRHSLAPSCYLYRTEGAASQGIRRQVDVR
jgi:hypothetical protein